MVSVNDSIFCLYEDLVAYEVSSFCGMVFRWIGVGGGA